MFRPGFLSKVRRTSVVEHYGVRTLLYGSLLPGPDIGKREASTLRAVRDAGFEVGVHCWDHIDWQDYLTQRDAAWTLRRDGARGRAVHADLRQRPAPARRRRMAVQRGGRAG